MTPKIKSVEILGATNRLVFALGYRVHGRMISSITLEDRFFAEVPVAMYVCADAEGKILATVSAQSPVVVEYIYE